MKKSTNNPALAAAITWVTLSLSVLTTHAASLSWTGTTGSWDDTANWSGGALPTAADAAAIENGGTAELGAGVSGTANAADFGYSGTGSLSITGGNLSSGFTRFAYNTGSSGAASVSSGTWSTRSLFLGIYGTATLDIGGGVVDSSYCALGANSTGVGTATVSGGAWGIGSTLFVGESGTGSLVIGGGMVTSQAGAVGYSQTGAGTATVTSGTWSISNN